MRLFLRLNGEQIPLAQVGGERLYFDKPVLLTPGPAEVVVEIDGEPRSRAILIPECSVPARVVAYSST